jgi:hypothetical protein
MKTIFTALPSPGFQVAYSKNHADYQVLSTGNVSECKWAPPVIEIITEEEDGTALRPFDASMVVGSSGIIIKGKSLSVLMGILDNYGNIFRLNCDYDELFYFNCTKILPAIDIDKSESRRLPNGRIIRIVRHVFFPEVVGSNDIFRISTEGVPGLFFTDKAVAIWNKSGVSGIEFRRVWVNPNQK